MQSGGLVFFVKAAVLLIYASQYQSACSDYEHTQFHSMLLMALQAGHFGLSAQYLELYIAQQKGGTSSDMLTGSAWKWCCQCTLRMYCTGSASALCCGRA